MEPMKADVRDRLYIGGVWVPSAGTGSIDVIDSTNEAVIGSVPEGTPEDVDTAVAAAAAAFPGWSSTPLAERTALLTKVSEALGARMESLADLITHEVGMPNVLSQLVQVGLPMASFGSQAAVAAELRLGEDGGELVGGARAGGRGGGHHPLELPAPPDRRQGGPGAGRRVHRRAEAQRGGAAERLRTGGHLRRGGAAAGGVQPGDRVRPRRG